MTQPRLVRLEMPDPELVEVYQQMSSVERFAAAFSTIEMVRSLLGAHIAGLNPTWSGAQVKREVARRILLGGG